MAETALNNDGEHWADGLITDDTPTNHAEALKGFDSQDDLTNAFLGGLDKNWREDFAKDAEGNVDTKFLSTLERYESPLAMGTAFREQKATISSGEHKKGPGPDATPEDINAYRTANNIPTEVDGYFKDLPDGLVVGEADQELMSDFAGAMHELNAPPEFMHKAIEWYNNFAEVQQDQMAELDAAHHQETEDTLRQEWGTDYRANVNLVGSLIESTFGEENATAIMNARDGEGRAIMNIPGVLQGLADLSRKMNPVAQIAPATNKTAIETLEDEMAGIEKVMRQDRKAYDKDEKMQSRYRELIQIKLDHDQRKTA